MLPKVAAAIIKHLKPISTKSMQSAPDTKVKDQPKGQGGFQRFDGKNEGQPQPEKPALRVIEGGQKSGQKSDQDSGDSTDKSKVLTFHASPLAFGKAISDFVHRLFAHDSYEKTSDQGKQDLSKGKKGALIDKKII